MFPKPHPHAAQYRMQVIMELPLARQISAHSSCLCNEVLSLAGRHLHDKISLIVKGTEMYDYFNKYSFDLPTFPDYHPIPKQEVVDAYTGQKRNAYARALSNIREGLKIKQWSRVKMFIKTDKHATVDLESRVDVKYPRAIQARDKEFNLLMASYLKPYEHMMYAELKSPIGLRVVAKGLNNLERAANIQAAIPCFHRPIFILMDHSKFDSYVQEVYIRWTHRQYKRTIRGSLFRQLISKTIHNVGTSKHGVRYKVTGTRMSGDFDTALGNTMINYMVITSLLREKGVKHHILLDGDDSVLICEQHDWNAEHDGLKLSLHMRSHCVMMGFVTKIFETTDPSEIEFCQSKYIEADPPRFARNPKRALSNYSVTLKDYAGDARLRYLAGVGRGELAASAGTPIMQAFSLALARAHTNPMFIEELAVAYGTASDPIDIDISVRNQYAEQWGIPVAEQLAIESQLTTPGRVSVDTLLHWYNCLNE